MEVLLLVQLEHKAEKREEQKFKELRELKTSYLRILGRYQETKLRRFMASFILAFSKETGPTAPAKGDSSSYSG